MIVTEKRIVEQEWYEIKCNKTGWDSSGWFFKDDGVSMTNEWTIVCYLDIDKHSNPTLGIADKEFNFYE